LYNKTGELGDDRRRPYRITAAGQAALVHQLASWERIVTAGQFRLGGLP